MANKVSAFILSIIFIMLFSVLIRNTEILDSSIEVNGKVESAAEFLSDEYFDELDELFGKVKIENDKWYVFDGSKKIAANAVINQMMDSLEKEANALTNHKNFNRFLETFDRNTRKLNSITERVHFFRNTLNTYSDAPTMLEDMINLTAIGKWKLFSARFHMFNNEENNGALNLKFVSAEGRFEAVYNSGTGEIVTDPANMGTYNYAPGSVNPIKYYNHNKYDKRPWKKWGNIEEFSYQDIIGLESENGSDEAKNNYKEIESWIHQRKDELLAP